MMSVQISDTAMTSEATSHYAHALAPGLWIVSWLPGRSLGRNQAITAMTIAEMVAATSRADLDDHLIAGLATELDLTGPDAIRRAG